MRYGLLIAGLFLASCAPTMQMANEAGGALQFGNRYSRAEAMAMAEAHCAKYGKLARVTDQSSDVVFNLAFECVAKS